MLSMLVHRLWCSLSYPLRNLLVRIEISEFLWPKFEANRPFRLDVNYCHSHLLYSVRNGPEWNNKTVIYKLNHWATWDSGLFGSAVTVAITTFASDEWCICLSQYCAAPHVGHGTPPIGGPRNNSPRGQEMGSCDNMRSINTSSIEHCALNNWLPLRTDCF